MDRMLGQNPCTAKARGGCATQPLRGTFRSVVWAVFGPPAQLACTTPSKGAGDEPGGSMHTAIHGRSMQDALEEAYRNAQRQRFAP